MEKILLNKANDGKIYTKDYKDLPCEIILVKVYNDQLKGENKEKYSFKEDREIIININKNEIGVKGYIIKLLFKSENGNEIIKIGSYNFNEMDEELIFVNGKNNDKFSIIDKISNITSNTCEIVEGVVTIASFGMTVISLYNSIKKRK